MCQVLYCTRYVHYFIQNLSVLRLLICLDWMCCSGRSCALQGSMPVFCLLGASCLCPLVTSEKCLQSLPNVPGAKSFQDENDLIE